MNQAAVKCESLARLLDEIIETKQHFVPASETNQRERGTRSRAIVFYDDLGVCTCDTVISRKVNGLFSNTHPSFSHPDI